MKKLLLVPLLVVLAACNTIAAGTGNVILDAKKGMIAADAAYTVVCGSVVRLHNEGQLTGRRFNTARQACLDADKALDQADAAIAVGDNAKAALAITTANKALDIASSAKGG